MLEKYYDWQGNLDSLVTTAELVFSDFDLTSDGEINVRMVRDYIQRGILGAVDKAGRELEFNYEHLLKLVLARVLLSDGWSLRKIAEHFNFSELRELEELFPSNDNPALSAVKRLRSSVKFSEPPEMSMSMPSPPRPSTPKPSLPRFGFSKTWGSFWRSLASFSSIFGEFRSIFVARAIHFCIVSVTESTLAF